MILANYSWYLGQHINHIPGYPLVASWPFLKVPGTSRGMWELDGGELQGTGIPGRTGIWCSQQRRYCTNHWWLRFLHFSYWIGKVVTLWFFFLGTWGTSWEHHHIWITFDVFSFRPIEPWISMVYPWSSVRWSADLLGLAPFLGWTH